jgi:GNAT superfamily N-acetyltransferase
VNYQDVSGSKIVRGTIRTLSKHDELPRLRDHLLRLDHESRHDRFHGFMDDSFVERYAEKCASDGTVIIAYLENGVVRGAAELHPPDTSSDSLPEIAFSVEYGVRRQGVGSLLFRKLIEEARARNYRFLRITTGAQNEAMRALANKFGAHLTFRYGESTGTIDVNRRPNQSRLLEVLVAAVRLAATRVSETTGTRGQLSALPSHQVPVRLSLPNFLTARRSTTTER